jgi:hypothetical protein
MEAAVLVAIFFLFMSTFVPLGMLSEGEDKARERRMAEHKMNARLLRLNI